MKKGRHRRFEEARKLKQSGPSAADLGIPAGATRSEEDEFAALAAKYGVVFDEDGDIADVDDAGEGERN